MNCKYPRVQKFNIPLFPRSNILFLVSLQSTLDYLRIRAKKEEALFFKGQRKKLKPVFKNYKTACCEVQICGPPITDFKSQPGRCKAKANYLDSSFPNSFTCHTYGFSICRCCIMFCSLQLVLTILLSVEDKSQMSLIWGFH